MKMKMVKNGENNKKMMNTKMKLKRDNTKQLIMNRRKLKTTMAKWQNLSTKMVAYSTVRHCIRDGGRCLGRSSKHLRQRVQYSLVVYVYACV